jgi:hypothetical protein
MALWGKTDVTGSKPKYLNANDAAKAFFVSSEEAALKTNHDKGINGAGWWLINEYTDSAGKPRYKAECLVAMSVANVVSGDAADDTTVADAEVTLTIGTQPAAQNTSAGAATFSITVTVNNGGTVTYQWQRAPVATPTKFANIAGATSSSVVLSGRTSANTGDLYRCVLSSTTGAVKATSSAAALTFVS